MFLLPGLGVENNMLAKYGFLSAFVDDTDHDVKYDRSVFLLFKPDTLERLQYFIATEYKRTKLLKEDYDYEGGYVVMAYSFPIEYELDYQRFLMGEYSKISPAYQKLFPEKVTIKRENGKIEQTFNVVTHVFQKSKGLRKHLSKKFYGETEKDENGNTEPLEWLDQDIELWSAPDLIGKDLLDINKIRGELITK